MADAGEEADLGKIGASAGQCGDAVIQIREERFEVMRPSHERIGRAVEDEGRSAALMQRVEYRSLVWQKAERAIGTRLTHDLAAAVPRAHVAVEIAAAHIRDRRSPDAYQRAVRRTAGASVRLASAVSRMAETAIGRTLMGMAASHGPWLLRTIARRTRLTA